MFAALAVATGYREVRLIRSELRTVQTTAWAEFLLRLDQRFLEKPIRDIASRIETGTLEITSENKWDVINYLGTFELLYEFEKKGILDRDVIVRYYADSIISASEHEGIREILEDEHSTIDWSRFRTLVKELKREKADQIER